MLKFFLGVGAGVAGLLAVQFVAKRVTDARINAINAGASQVDPITGGMVNRGGTQGLLQVPSHPSHATRMGYRYSS